MRGKIIDHLDNTIAPKMVNVNEFDKIKELVKDLEYTQNESKQATTKIENSVRKKADYTWFTQQKTDINKVNTKVENLEFKITNLATKMKLQELEDNWVSLQKDLTHYKTESDTLLKQEYYTKQEVNQLLTELKTANSDVYIEKSQFSAQCCEIDTLLNSFTW